MELVRKFGLWVVALLIISGALAFYFLKVSKLDAQSEEKKKEVSARRDRLEVYADKPQGIPNDAKIEAKKVENERKLAELDNAALVLAMQPNFAHQRRFYEGEHIGEDRAILGEAQSKFITKSFQWLEAYERHNETLQEKINAAGFGRIWMVKAVNYWGQGLPEAQHIVRAQELFWFQKDLLDALSNTVEQELATYMQPAPGEENTFPSSPFDLVISRTSPGSQALDQKLRLVKHEILWDVAEAILLNDNQEDLATVFNRYLAPDLNWENVTALTMNEEQDRFLNSLVRDPADPFNRGRFRDFVIELRTVRYSTDVADLLELGEFTAIAESIRRMSTEERARLRAEIRRWGRTKTAQVIAAIVEIKDERGYVLVRDNHSPQIATLSNLTISPPFPTGGSGDLIPQGGNDVYIPWEFSMQIKIEFEHIPVLVHRMISNNWRYKIAIKNIVPVTGSRAREPVPGERDLDVPHMAPPGGPLPPGVEFNQPHGPEYFPDPAVLPVAPDMAEEGEPEIVRNYVRIDISGVGHQFSPLYERFRDKIDALRKTPTVGPADADAALPVPEGN